METTPRHRGPSTEPGVIPRGGPEPAGEMGAPTPTAGIARQTLTRALVVALAVAAFHATVASGTFQYDDGHAIVGNPHIRQLSSLPRFFTDATTFSGNSWAGMYRPLVLVSHAACWVWGGGDDAPFRVFNALVHGACAGLVTLLVAALGAGTRGAALAGLAFGLLPVNGEVAWYFSSRSESLCALFTMLSFLLYLVASTRSGRGRLWLTGSVAAFAMALLSKEVAAVLPGLLVAWELMARRRPGSLPALAAAIARCQWPYWAVAGVYLVGMRGHVLRATVGEPVRTYGVQLATQTKAWVYYTLLLWHPTGLTVEHQFRLANSWAGALAVGPALLLLASCVWLVARLWGQAGRRSRTGSPVPGFLALWAVAGLAPTSLIPLNVLVNEHRLYLASLSFVALLAWTARDLWGRHRRAGPVAVAALVGIYGLLSAQRSAVWADAGALWTDAAAKAPLMPRPHLFLGDYYKSAGQYSRALAEYSLVESVYPDVLSSGDRLQLHNNRGAALLAMGRSAAAVEEYRRALRINPAYAPAREALEGLLAVGGGERDPQAESLHKRGLAALVGGRLAEAESRFRASLNLQSWPDTWLSLALSLERMGRTEEARSAYASLALAGRGTRFERTARRRLSQLGLEGEESAQLETEP